MALIGRRAHHYTGLQAWTRGVLAEFVSKEDWCWHKRFGFPIAWDVALERWRAVVPVDRPLQTCVMVNDFPYWLTEEIDHQVLWCTHRLGGAELDELSRASLPQTREFVVGVQDKLLDAYDGVFHAHIFSRPKRA